MIGSGIDSHGDRLRTGGIGDRRGRAAQKGELPAGANRVGLDVAVLSIGNVEVGSLGIGNDRRWLIPGREGAAAQGAEGSIAGDGVPEDFAARGVGYVKVASRGVAG